MFENDMLDTHKSIKSLETAGFTDKQSEAFVEVLVGALEVFSNSIKTEIRQDIKEMETKNELRFKEMETKNELRFKEMETKNELRFKELDVRFKELDVRFKELENKINMVLVKVSGTMFSLLLGFKILDKFI